ncbi:MAG: hypothetical protein JWO97_4602 [Acidobacteria bacterium]|nr:hypothetical protein [Acidobacteriota bacterium]
MKFAHVALAIVLSVSAVSTSVAAEKKVWVQELVVVAPDNYQDLVSDSPVIARVHINGSHVRATPTTGAHPPTIFTEYTATVTETFRGGARTGKRITFRQVCGENEDANNIVRVEGAEPLTVDADYVVFLRYVPSRGIYALTGEREGVFKICRGAIDPQGESLIATEREGVSEKQFVQELRRAIARRPAKVEQ